MEGNSEVAMLITDTVWGILEAVAVDERDGNGPVLYVYEEAKLDEIGERVLELLANLSPESIYTKEAIIMAARRVAYPSDVWELDELQGEIDAVNELNSIGRSE
jgi:hypothetical protein